MILAHIHKDKGSKNSDAMRLDYKHQDEPASGKDHKNETRWF